MPAPLRERLALDPGSPEVDGLTLLLLTLRDDGWPHQAMLSVGELCCPADDRVRLATWPASTATANLRTRGRATLTAVVGGVAYALRLRTLSSGELAAGARSGALVGFELEVVAATADEAPYARLLDGVRFALNDRPATIERWREVRAALCAEAPR